MTTTEKVGVTVTFKEPITFHLRMISIDEENKLRQKMFGLTEEEKAEKAYQNNVDMLADLSEKIPAGMFPNKPNTIAEDAPKTHYFEDFTKPEVAVQSFFAERTVLKERIAEYAVRGYFVRIAPDVNFS